MPETGEPEQIDPQQPNETREDYLVRINRSQVREMEAKAKAHDDAEARAVAAERQLAFAKAGIDLSTDDEKAQFFMQGYQGELDPAAIKAKAEAFGVLSSTPAPAPTAETPAEPAPVVDTPLEPGEANLTSERRALASSAPPDTPAPADPFAEAQRVHDKVIEDGGQEKHAIGSALNVLANAAARGDQRVILGQRGGTGA